VRTGRLVTASCTTGWRDWVHGELWVLPDGLLRRRLDVARTRAHGRGPTVVEDGDTQEFDDEAIARIGQAHPTNAWVPSHAIASAHLHEGVLTSRLRLTLTGADQVKLLWLRADPAAAPLREALVGWAVPVG
jgi:hypothetical protein